MAKFRVYANAVVSAWADVEAENGEEAVEKVWEEDLLPYAPGFSDYEFGVWQSPSEFDESSKPEDDYREVEA